MRRLVVLAALALTGCPSGQPVRGVVHPGSETPSQSSSRCHGSTVDAWAPPGFCVTKLATGLTRPRHLVFAPNGDLLVATRQGIAVLRDANGDGEVKDDERKMIGAPDISQQGVAISPDGKWLYVADSRVVRRMPLGASSGAGEIVVKDVFLTVDHPYRTITFDKDGRLYLVVGADDNLTPGGGAVIMRYSIPAQIPQGGVAYDSGERFAVGIRNAEALAWDHTGALWAFVNGRDYLHPAGTPDNFYLDHPGDWVFKLSDKPGTFYGFPHCWALGTVPWGDRKDPGSQWADPDANGGHDDAWCQNAANVHPAAGALAAHTAPLGAVEYTGSLLPAKYKNTFFVTSHGSWNRHGEQRGRVVYSVRVEGDKVTSIEAVVGERGSDGNLHEGGWNERPVGIAQGPDGALYVSCDETGDILRVGYEK